MPEIRVLIQHWADIEKLVTEFRDNARVSMEQAHDTADLWRAQGAVRALNMILNLPNIIPVLKGETQ